METVTNYLHRTATERENIGRLSDREVNRIHGWSRTSDEDRYEFNVENTGPNQVF